MPYTGSTAIHGRAHNPSDALANRLEAEDCDGRWQEHWQQHGFGYWTIRRRTGPATDQPLGFCGGQHRRAAGPPGRGCREPA